MFRWHKIYPPPGFELVINGKVEERVPVRVGSEDQVYFVNFASLFLNEKVVASSKEGVSHEVTVAVKLQFQRVNLSDVLRGAGYSIYRNPVRATMKAFVDRQNVVHEIRATIQTLVQAVGFFQLADQDAIRNDMHQRISGRCQGLGLEGEVVSCNVVPVLPEKNLLAQLSAKALSDTSYKPIVEYFAESMRSLEFLDAKKEEAKVQAQKDIEKARNDLKVFQIEDNNRVAVAEQKSKEQAEDRQKDDQERNARLKTHNAELEFIYKKTRLEEDKELAEKELEVTNARLEGEKVKRGTRREDMKIEIDRERSLSEIRKGEITEIIQKLKDVPVPDYSGIQTLITGTAGGPEAHRDLASGLVLGLLGKITDTFGSRGDRNQSKPRQQGMTRQ